MHEQSEDQLSREDLLVKWYGFDPQTVSATAYRFGIIDSGPRAGFLCVYTRDLHVDQHARLKRNFVDADRGYNPYNGDPRWLVYIFAPLPAYRGIAAA